LHSIIDDDVFNENFKLRYNKERKSMRNLKKKIFENEKTKKNYVFNFTKSLKPRRRKI